VDLFILTGAALAVVAARKLGRRARVVPAVRIAEAAHA